KKKKKKLLYSTLYVLKSRNYIFLLLYGIKITNFFLLI
ncbi:hypothetical protein C923_04085, partial [Plasmodium falciparum UGT5.1]